LYVSTAAACRSGRTSRRSVPAPASVATPAAESSPQPTFITSFANDVIPPSPKARIPIARLGNQPVRISNLYLYIETNKKYRLKSVFFISSREFSFSQGDCHVVCFTTPCNNKVVVSFTTFPNNKQKTGIHKKNMSTLILEYFPVTSQIFFLCNRKQSWLPKASTWAT